MKSLSPNIINNLLLSSNDIQKSITDLVNCINSDGPAKIEGLQGSLSSFYTYSFINEKKIKQNRYLQYKDTKNNRIEKKSISKNILDFVIIVSSTSEANNLFTDLQTLTNNGEMAEIYKLPNWGTLPYRPVSIGSAIFGQRAYILAKLSEKRSLIYLNTKPRIFIILQQVLQTPVPPPDYISSLSFQIQTGQIIDMQKFSAKLTEIGYTRVPRVTVHGEFSLRGEVLDIFMAEEDYAYRIVFNYDAIEHIKYFDVVSQTTVKKEQVLDRILIYPMKEVIWTDFLVKKLEIYFNNMEKQSISNSKEKNKTENIHLGFTENAKNYKDTLLTELLVNKESEGEELYYSALWDKNYSILDYLSNNTTIIYNDYDRILNAESTLIREYEGLYRKARQELPVFSPDQILFSLKKLTNSHTQNIFFKSLHTSLSEDELPLNSNTLNKSTLSFDNVLHYSINSEPARSFFGNINYLREQLALLQKDNWNIFIFADNENQSRRIKELLKNLNESENKNLKPVNIFPLAISEGFSITDLKLLVIQENEIFGRRKYVPKSLRHAKSEVLDTFIELNPGDYVVHVNYGIGIFKGIQRVKAMGNERDYIKLQYADDEIAFVPLEQVNMVQRYIGNEGGNPHIDRIGSKSWEKRKEKVKKSVEDIAKKLIDLYSKRKASRGYAFPIDTEWQVAFEAAFPYEDTPDQITASAEIKKDMESPIPMDRLLCGDVGYGKTEIAMRAAFKAVMGGKQVSFLAPTTILAEQHYENCLERFKDFPVQIAMMSRFITPAQQKKVLQKLKIGDVDILIGTHRIIQKDVKFKNLGLMIIDEEQRFGVKDKEKLKIVKNNIDSLSMSATPIPRTLHMSLLKIRDMSLLTTPPQNRQPIETVIEEYNDQKIAEAIRNEVERGGQVFYLHNRVESLYEVQKKLEKIVPEMLIDIAHGQMSSEQLDDIFRRFKMGGFHVLVATTIIENGIDIPNVNTIIIDRADMYGVSQLYQLRGRVGRSDRKAYAFLFYPKNKSLSDIAMKRLQVISDFTELGSGFKIAMKDMEIRGAGNLLGKDQSGEVITVGFELYLKLLNEAVERLVDTNYISVSEVIMEFEYTGYIPDTYIDNSQTKMEIYKKIAAVQHRDELENLYTELEDRFGPLPDELYSLLSLSEIRIICKQLSISSIKEKKGIISVDFAKVSDISIDKLLKLIKASSGTVKLDSSKPNIIILNTGKVNLKQKSDFIKEKLEFLL